MKNLIQVAIRYLLEQKKRTILTITGITMSIAMITAIASMSYSYDRYDMETVISNLGYNHAAFLNIPAEDYKYIENNASFSHVAKSTMAGTALYENEAGISNFIDLIGYENEYLDLRNKVLLPIEGRLPENEGEIVLERWKALELGLQIGDVVTLPVGLLVENGEALNRGDEIYDEVIFHETYIHSFELVGFLGSNNYSKLYNHSRAIVDNAWAQRVNDTDKVTAIVRVHEGLDIYESIYQVQHELGIEGNDVEYNQVLVNREQNRIPPSMVSVAIFLIVLVCLASVAVIFNSFNISVIERIKQLGVLRSIGTTPSQIRKLVFAEASILGIISIPLGLVLGFYGTKLLFYLFSLGEFSSFKSLEIITSPLMLLGSSIIGLVAVYLSAFFPAMGAGRVSPLDAIFQHRSLKRDDKTKKGVLVGKIFGTEGFLAYKNVKRNRKRMVITTFSISVSVVLFLVFSVFTNYILTVIEIEQAYSWDFEMRAWEDINNNYNVNYYTEDELIEIQNIEGVGQIVPLNYHEITAVLKKEHFNDSFKEHNSDNFETGMIRGTLYGYSTEMLQQAEIELKEGHVHEDLLNEEMGVLVVVNNQYYDDGERGFTEIADINIGDTIDISIDRNGDGLVQVKVMGILEKKPIGPPYPWLRSIGIITTQEVFEQITGVAGYTSIYVNMDQDEKYKEIVPALEAIADRPERGLADNIGSYGRERQVLLEVSVLVYGFIIMISLIAALNIINTLTSNLLTRTKEFGMLRAVGMSPKSMRRMIQMEAIFTSVTGAFFGLITGNILGYYLLILLSVHHGYPWEFPYKTNIIVIIATVLIALVAVITPLRKIASLNIIETIKED